MPDNAAPLIVLTRPQAASDRFGAACAQEFGTAVELVITPLQRIEALDALPTMDGVGALIFSSENGVAVAADALERRDLPVFCVGDRTAEVAAAAGFAAQSASGNADDLVVLVRNAAPSGVIWHLHGRNTRGEVVERLRQAGFRTGGVAIYDQVEVTPSSAFHQAMSGEKPVIVPLFSPRSAALFVAALGDLRPAQFRLPCLSDAVRDALPVGLRAHAFATDAPTAMAMLAAIARELSP